MVLGMNDFSRRRKSHSHNIHQPLLVFIFTLEMSPPYNIPRGDDITEQGLRPCATSIRSIRCFLLFTRSYPPPKKSLPACCHKFIIRCLSVDPIEPHSLILHLQRVLLWITHLILVIQQVQVLLTPCYSRVV